MDFPANIHAGIPSNRVGSVAHVSLAPIPPHLNVAVELEDKIKAAKLDPAPTPESLQEISVLLAKATKTLADATGGIPTYDQRQYEIVRFLHAYDMIKI